jgi:DMSO/TMAO reductase YedYZ heme-binding membrane subunit
MTRSRSEHWRSATTWIVTGVAALVLPMAAGFGFASLFAPTLHSKYFPWITGRALGIAGYLSLTALVALGIWMRHPSRFRWPSVHSETRLRLHATIGTATIALVVGHLASLASDHYAGVGWVGAFVPGVAKYRTFAVSLGIIALFFMILLMVSARTAGRRGARHWYLYHRFSIVTFLLVWFHGVLAGTDTTALRVLYMTTGVGVGLLALTRYTVSQSAGRSDGESVRDRSGGEFVPEDVNEFNGVPR